MEIYTKKVTFSIWLDNFWFEIMIVEKKRPVFFHIFIFILANETKDHNRVYKKKHFLVVFGFFG